MVSSQAMWWTCPLPYTGRVRALEIRPGPWQGLAEASFPQWFPAGWPGSPGDSSPNA